MLEISSWGRLAKLPGLVLPVEDIVRVSKNKSWLNVGVLGYEDVDHEAGGGFGDEEEER